jgi:hypothetical protein
MGEIYTYIKKLLALLVTVFAGFYLHQFLEYYFLVPLLLLTFSVLVFQITGKKPPHLFDFKRIDHYYEKGGLRDLLKLFITAFGVVYDIIIWTFWGVFLLFEVFTDILRLLKIISFWIIYAILWFLRLFVPPVVIIFRLIIHYGIKWIWWIYQLAFKNMSPSVNRNYYFLAVRGTIPAIFIAFVFYYFSLIIDLHGLAIVGLVLSVLPLAWSFGEIASVRSKNLQNEGFTTIRTNFQNGIESVRSLLFYITFFVILFVVQLALNLTGWMPGAGISLLGVAVNLNTFISFLLILLTLIILFGILMIPTYRLYNYFRENTLSGTVTFLSSVLKKGIQYILVLIPSTLFGSILLIIPSVLLVTSLWLTFTLKNEVLDIRLNQMQEQQLEVNDELQAYELNKNIEQLKYLKILPHNLFQKMFNRNNLNYKENYTEDNIRKEEEKLLRLENRTKARLKTLDDQITLSESPANKGDIASLKEQKLLVSRTFSNQKADIEMVISKYKIDLKYLHRNSQQIPILFFLAGIWISLFGGLVLSFVTAFLGNVFYELYLFRNDGTPSYFETIILHENEKDNKQPLLGFSLLIIIITIIYLLYRFGFPYQLTGI